jgi:O-antigen ligase
LSRLFVLSLFVGTLAIWAVRDWYKSLCGLILLMGVIEHPDMPKSIFGIQGLNPWNILLVFVVYGWAVNRQSEGLEWDLPGTVVLAGGAYLLVILAGIWRMLEDLGRLTEAAAAIGGPAPTVLGLISEHGINSLKWVLPGLLLFDGCRSPGRFYLGFFSVLAVYFFLGVQVIRWMPLESALTGADLTARSLKILVNEVGYHRVNLSMMLAGAMWAVMISSLLTERAGPKALLIAASGVIFFAQALTGGRTGYGTWVAVGIGLGLLRYRKYLLILPLAAALITAIVPGVYERLGQGFSPETKDERIHLAAAEPLEDEPDLYTITAGRNIAWPYIIEKIREAPFIGYGRLAMNREGISAFLWKEYRESFPHPHNAYLELILDNGILGAIPVLLFFVLVILYSTRLFRDPRHRLFTAVGGATLALGGAFLIASIGSQTFYPREGAVGMWCMIGLMLRIYRLRTEAEAVSSGPGVLRHLPWAGGRSAHEAHPHAAL